VYAYVERRVEIRAEAEDLVSDVFHQALANLRRYEWRGSPFSAWLFHIAANKIADRWERRREAGLYWRNPARPFSECKLRFRPPVNSCIRGNLTQNPSAGGPMKRTWNDYSGRRRAGQLRMVPDAVRSACWPSCP
jgi:hypothetical protein